jgi:hypothetical protein
VQLELPLSVILSVLTSFVLDVIILLRILTTLSRSQKEGPGRILAHPSDPYPVLPGTAEE